ncbi:DinB family protein [bacterium]|nr:DinB family protein [bacterium]
MGRIASRRPCDSEITSEYHRQLIQNVEGECALRILETQMHWLCELASHLSTEQIDKIHKPYSWTVRQVFAHCVEAERFFGTRIQRFVAGDEQPLRSFDHEKYADQRYGLGSFSGLISELGFLRQANLLLLRRVLPTVWDHSGKVDNDSITVRSLAWLAAGHLQHHLKIVEQRCGVTISMPG